MIWEQFKRSGVILKIGLYFDGEDTPYETFPNNSQMIGHRSIH